VSLARLARVPGAHIHPKAFDPKPFIANFEVAVDQLISLRKEIQTKTEQIEKSVRVSEREYSKKMAELNRRFEVRVYAFIRLSALLNRSGSGHQL
jgi:hypothetical protein